MIKILIKNIINNLFNYIKVDGCEVFKINVKGNKSNKNIFKLLKILDFLIKKISQKVNYNFLWWRVVGDMFGLLSYLFKSVLFSYTINNDINCR